MVDVAIADVIGLSIVTALWLFVSYFINIVMVVINSWLASPLFIMLFYCRMLPSRSPDSAVG